MNPPPSTPELLVILGPTASGKSALALRLAERIGGEIVCADSAQVYRGMDVGTAKASPEARSRVRHHCLDLVEPDEPMNAARWVGAADAAIAEAAGRGRVPIVEGGTFLYVRALLEGLFAAPPPDPAIRSRHRERARSEGVPALHAELWKVDPRAAGRIAPNDLVRVSRALELWEQTGVPMSELQVRERRTPRYPARTLALVPPRAGLYERIDERAARIFTPLVEEVRELRARGVGALHASQQALGYREAGAVLDGRLSAGEALALLARDTRRYAKRQLTWIRSLRADPALRVYNRPEEVDPEAEKLMRTPLGAIG